jgi:phosphohistidine phosphatase
MLTLSLLRHAKSSWKNPGLPDRERPLSSPGLAAAPLIGKAIADRRLVPDLVLCSSSRRTRETLEHILPFLTPPPEAILEDELYDADPDLLLDQVRRQARTVRHLMLIGHNPGLQVFAEELIGSGPLHARDRLNAKLPTCGLVVIGFKAGDWADLAYGSGELTLFLVPSDLGLTPSPVDP